MKRVLSLLVLALSVALFTGCGDNKPASGTKPAAGAGGSTGGGGNTQPSGEKK